MCVWGERLSRGGMLGFQCEVSGPVAHARPLPGCGDTEAKATGVQQPTGGRQSLGEGQGGHHGGGDA